MTVTSTINGLISFHTQKKKKEQEVCGKIMPFEGEIVQLNELIWKKRNEEKIHTKKHS